MRAIISMTLLALGACFNVVELTDMIEAHWKAQGDGNAVAFVSHLARGFTQTVNGEADTTPWTDEKYVQGLFRRTNFPVLAALSAMALAGPNTIIVVIEWEVRFKDTLDTLHMGEWQQTYLFNDAGKIFKLSSICDGASVQKYNDLLSQPIEDYRPAFKVLVLAFNTKDVNGVLSAFVPEDVYWKRNGENETFTWVRARFLGFLFQQAFTLTLDAFASAVPRTAYATLTWTHTSSVGKVTVIPDSWFVTWNPEGKISHVRSITNGLEKVLYASMMPSITDSLSPDAKEDLRKLYQTGAVTNEDLRKHLDL